MICIKFPKGGGGLYLDKNILGQEPLKCEWVVFKALFVFQLLPKSEEKAFSVL